jgi:V8-like Glu-specific endopeptidase
MHTALYVTELFDSLKSILGIFLVLNNIMRLINKTTITLFSISVLAFVNISSTNFEEGMFPLSEISKLDLAKEGLKIPQKHIYNPDSISLIDALVNVGGCTGSFVSEKGLIITNHHCAYSAVQLASTPQNDYLENGFVANTLEQEIEAKGLTCRITDSYEDVSEEVLGETKGVSDATQRINIIKNKIIEIEKRAESADSTITAEVSEMFIGKSYVLFKYKIIRDVRLVYIPQRTIGEFGGETDNWVWPRHTGDFSFMRAYVAKDGSSAPYSKDNVPYEPKKFLKINPAGVKDGDFTFILGYPGRTFRHRPSQFIAYQQNFQLPYVADLYAFQNSKMEEISKQKGRATELALATRIKRNANVMKNYQGKLKGLKNTELLKQKQQDDQNLATFINENIEIKQQYGNLMLEIDNLYKQMNGDVYRDLWFDQIYNSSNLLKVAANINAFKKKLEQLPLDQREAYFSVNAGKLEKFLNGIYDSYDPDVDKALFANMIERASKLPPNQKLRFVDSKIKGFNTSEQINSFTNNLFQFTRLKDRNFVIKNIFKDAKFILSYKDPLLNFEEELSKHLQINENENDLQEAKLNKLISDYVTVKEVYLNKNFIPDANSTLRLTYGHVSGFSPVDGSYMMPFTTIKGIIEKGRSNNEDFQYPAAIQSLWEAKDFGQYQMEELKDVPVCFLYNMDTTGGNSGSPILNAYGELVGVNFDRAYEATINDYAWNQNYSRSIGVDIRYVLWVATKIDKADHILRELGI